MKPFFQIFKKTLIKIVCFRRNNSARELSAFAESAMAVNRVVLQHFSVNLEELLENREPRLSTSSTDDDNHPYGHLSDSSSERSDGKRCGHHSSCEFDRHGSTCSVQSSCEFGAIKTARARASSISDNNNLIGLSPPSESRLMQRRIKARASLCESVA